MVKTLNVSESGYYSWLKKSASPSKIQREILKLKVLSIYNESYGIYGAPKIKASLDKLEINTSIKHVQNLMKELGIRSKTRKKYKATTNSKHNYPVSENILNQNFKVAKLGQVWVSDITYIPTSEGFLYLASIMDLYSKRIIGFDMDIRMPKELVLSALEKAIKCQKPKEGLIHHSDRGVQYCSTEYQKRLKTNKIISSMSRKGNCYDNACIESFHSIIKKELIYQKKFMSREEAKIKITEYILHFYNCKRIHSSIGYETPIEHENEFFKNQKIAS